MSVHLYIPDGVDVDASERAELKRRESDWNDEWVDQQKRKTRNGLSIYRYSFRGRKRLLLGKFFLVKKTWVLAVGFIGEGGDKDERDFLIEGSRRADRLRKRMPTAAEVHAWIEGQAEPVEDDVRSELPRAVESLLVTPSIRGLVPRSLQDYSSDEGPTIDLTSALIYETRSWVDKARDYMRVSDLFREVTAAAELPPGSKRDSRAGGFELHLVWNQLAIVYRWFEIEEPVHFYLLVLVDLLTPEDGDSHDWIERSDRWQSSDWSFVERLDEPNAEVLTLRDQDPAAAVARRAYPGFLLADDQSWCSMQRQGADNIGAGLALSAEELRLLHEIGGAASGTSTTPLFINGRAGSGKSTMLAYLYAAYFVHYVASMREIGNSGSKEDDSVHDLAPIPAYLSLNSRLLEPASQLVEYLVGEQSGLATKLTEEEREQLSSSFVDVRTLLRFLLPPKELAAFSDPGAEIGFSEFSQMYSGRLHSSGAYNLRPYRGERRVPAEAAWWIIRSFIKGNGPDELTPEAYSSLPRADQVVEPITYSFVYEKIWKGWYRNLLIGHGGVCWDDQDLALSALEALNDRSSPFRAPKIGILFCDEAQDFTRLELQALFRCSALSDFDLRNRGQIPLPFVFAGDQMQTVNPSGFRWDRFRASFFDEVVTPLGLGNFGAGDYVKLASFAINYRSDSPIVRFLNAVNLVRSKVFSYGDLEPQKPWRDEVLSEPWKMIVGDEAVRPIIDLLGTPESPALILPCNEGEIAHFIANDEILSEIFPNPDSELPVWTAADIKGLQYPSVILYKFGDYAVRSGIEIGRLIEPRDRPASPSFLVDEFFFNKLYVAASRAENQLIILDSVEGDEHFWRFFTQTTGESFGLAHLTGPDSVISESDLETWDASGIGVAGAREVGGISELQLDDAQKAETGGAWFSEGRMSCNPRLLRHAARMLDSISWPSPQQKELAREAKAWARLFEGEHLEAALMFEDLNQWGHAWESYWQASDWKSLERWRTKAPPESVGNFEVQASIVAVMAADDSSVEALEACLSGMVGADRLLTASTKGSPLQWNQITAKLLAEFERYRDELDAGCRRWAYEVFGLLGELRQVGAASMAASLAFELQQWDRALHYWDISGDDAPPGPRAIAAARRDGYPVGLHHLNEVLHLDDVEREVLTQWESTGRPMNADWAPTLARLFGRAGRSLEAAEAELVCQRPVAALRQLESFLGSDEALSLSLNDSRQLEQIATAAVGQLSVPDSLTGSNSQPLHSTTLESVLGIDVRSGADTFPNVRSAKAEGQDLLPRLRAESIVALTLLNRTSESRASDGAAIRLIRDYIDRFAELEGAQSRSADRQVPISFWGQMHPLIEAFVREQVGRAPAPRSRRRSNRPHRDLEDALENYDRLVASGQLNSDIGHLAKYRWAMLKAHHIELLSANCGRLEEEQKLWKEAGRERAARNLSRARSELKDARDLRLQRMREWRLREDEIPSDKQFREELVDLHKSLRAPLPDASRRSAIWVVGRFQLIFYPKPLVVAIADVETGTNLCRVDLRQATVRFREGPTERDSRIDGGWTSSHQFSIAVKPTSETTWSVSFTDDLTGDEETRDLP